MSCEHFFIIDGIYSAQARLFSERIHASLYKSSPFLWQYDAAHHVEQPAEHRAWTLVYKGLCQVRPLNHHLPIVAIAELRRLIQHASTLHLRHSLRAAFSYLSRKSLRVFNPPTGITITLPTFLFAYPFSISSSLDRYTNTQTIIFAYSINLGLERTLALQLFNQKLGCSHLYPFQRKGL